MYEDPKALADTIYEELKSGAEHLNPDIIRRLQKFIKDGIIQSYEEEREKGVGKYNG